jgi:mannose-1-phosphate guanylyltransferase
LTADLVTNMKAMLLAAGKSTRLGPLGQVMPKPMLPLGGRPILEWTVRRLRESGITELAINLHHLPAIIRGHFGDGSAFGVRITYQEEAEILGTAGAVRRASGLLGDGDFLVVYADNVLDWDVRAMVEAHSRDGGLGSIAVAQVADPSRSGVVSFGADRAITSFLEKPGDRPELGNWVNAGVYVLGREILDHIPDSGHPDFGYDVFPELLRRGSRLLAYPLARQPLAVDTLDLYEDAQGRFGQGARSSLAL